MYRLKFKLIPSFKFIIGNDFVVQMLRESRKNLPRGGSLYLWKLLSKVFFFGFVFKLKILFYVTYLDFQAVFYQWKTFCKNNDCLYMSIVSISRSWFKVNSWRVFAPSTNVIYYKRITSINIYLSHHGSLLIPL